MYLNVVGASLTAVMGCQLGIIEGGACVSAALAAAVSHTPMHVYGSY